MHGRPGPCGCGCALSPETSLGFSAVDFSQTVLGIDPLPWQRWLLIHALERLPDGRFRFRTVLVLVARQNGKTTIVEVKNLWKMFVLRVPLVVGTAQNLDISEESWEKAVEIVEGIPDLACEVTHVDRTNGKKALRLANGSRWKIAAASRKGGRGLSGDDVNLDELREHQTWDSWSAVTKTTMARRKAQIWAFSNAGDDRSVVLNDLQLAGRGSLDNPGSSLGLFEWSAPDDCPIDDPRFWAMANPSLGYTIQEEALRSALETDPEPVFRTECLCQRVPDLLPPVFPAGVWNEQADPGSRVVDPVVFAVGATPERGFGSIGVAGARSDGLLHGELIDNQPGVAWMLPRLIALNESHEHRGIIIDPASAAGSLIPGLQEAGIEPELVTGRERAAACGAFYDAVVEDGRFRHLNQPQLNAAVAGAKRKDMSDAWVFDRKTPGVDISPLDAVSLAVFGHLKHAGDDEGAPNLWI